MKAKSSHFDRTRGDKNQIFPTLESLQIKDHNPYSPSPIVFNCFKNLKELIVPKLCFINAMIGDINSLTHLFVENASLQEFKDFDFANIGEKLKKLRKFDVKGQIISECPYEIIVWTKIPTKKFPRFLP